MNIKIIRTETKVRREVESITETPALLSFLHSYFKELV